MDDDKKRIWIFAGAGCGVVLVAMCCLMATGLYYCKAAWDEASDTTEAFLADVREGRIERAYERMAQEYRADKDLAAFRRDVEQTPGLLDHTEAHVRQRSFEPGQVRVGGVLQTPEGAIPFELTLVESAGRLWVAGVQVGELEAPDTNLDPPPAPPPADASLDAGAD